MPNAVSYCACVRYKIHSYRGSFTIHVHATARDNVNSRVLHNIARTVALLMDVSPESNARFKAFRQLVYHCSEQLTNTETHALIYIWLYSERESYKDAPAIRVLSRLESKGHFSPINPEGLLEMLKELKRNDLCSEVRDFMKTKWPKVVKREKRKCVCDDEDLQATFEVVLAQTTVLLQQIEAFEKVLQFGRDTRGRARDVITGAAQTAKSLADRLIRAQSELYSESTAETDQYVDLTSIRAPRSE